MERFFASHSLCFEKTGKPERAPAAQHTQRHNLSQISGNKSPISFFALFVKIENKIKKHL